MAQEFTIKSQDIEDKINQLLPSQGGYAPGVDFSASTMVIPIVDLTETAEGSCLRQDLQSAISYGSATIFDVSNALTTVINTTGYWKCICTVSQATSATTNSQFNLIITDGVTPKSIIANRIFSTAQNGVLIPLELIFKLDAGESFQVFSGSTRTFVRGSVRQLADVNGNLINP